MFAPLQTITLQRTAFLAAGLIGMGCCLAAVLDMRSQQAEERPASHPIAGNQAASSEIHRLHGLLHKIHEPAPAQRVDAGARSLG